LVGKLVSNLTKYNSIPSQAMVVDGLIVIGGVLGMPKKYNKFKRKIIHVSYTFREPYY
jgi:hypothetical protein